MASSSRRHFFSRTTPEDFERQLRDAEAQKDASEFSAQVNEFLGTLLSDFNQRDVRGVNQALDKVEQALAGEFEAIELRFGGSVAKHTYVDGLSDVDALLVLSPDEIGDMTPTETKALCEKKLATKFGKENVHSGNLAVTVKYGDHELQFLPAMRSGEGFKISGEGGEKWAKIHPKEFASALTEANQTSGNKLVPVIKLAKAVVAQFPEQRRMSGYHVEALAVQAFKDYKGRPLYSEMLQHLFSEMSQRILTASPDITGQSDYVDEYLGANNSVPRRAIADSCERIARKIQNANGAQSVEMWKALFEEP